MSLMAGALLMGINGVVYGQPPMFGNQGKLCAQKLHCGFETEYTKYSPTDSIECSYSQESSENIDDEAFWVQVAYYLMSGCWLLPQGWGNCCRYNEICEWYELNHFSNQVHLP